MLIEKLILQFYHNFNSYKNNPKIALLSIILGVNVYNPKIALLSIILGVNVYKPKIRRIYCLYVIWFRTSDGCQSFLIQNSSKIISWSLISYKSRSSTSKRSLLVFISHIYMVVPRFYIPFGSKVLANVMRLFVL